MIWQWIGVVAVFCLAFVCFWWKKRRSKPEDGCCASDSCGKQSAGCDGCDGCPLNRKNGD